MKLYIGIMSGTSADGIDAVLMDFDTNSIVGSHSKTYSPQVREKILRLFEPGANEIELCAELDVLLGEEFALVVNELLIKTGKSSTEITALGSHGQTIRHSPNSTPAYTLQIGDPNTIAARTGITTVADFRRKDLALGGQGAPLVPAFHHYLFGTDEEKAVVNIGGIANVTYLSKNADVLGFDTGPGNVFLDSWMSLHNQKAFDNDGEWAKSGTVHRKLLEIFLEDCYFQKPPPKSTGREYFNLYWLNQKLTLYNKNQLGSEDIQATLTELTAQSIINSIQKISQPAEIIICGGGAYNKFLMERIRALSKEKCPVHSTNKYHIPPKFIEAMAFAWFAKQTLHKQNSNLPSVTGASKPAILGGIYFPS